MSRLYAVLEVGERRGVPYADVRGHLSASNRPQAERRATAVLGIPCQSNGADMIEGTYLRVTAWGHCKRWLKKAAGSEGLNLATVYVRVSERATGKTVKEIKTSGWDEAWKIRSAMNHNINDKDYGRRTVEKFERRKR